MTQSWSALVLNNGNNRDLKRDDIVVRWTVHSGNTPYPVSKELLTAKPARSYNQEKLWITANYNRLAWRYATKWIYRYQIGCPSELTINTEQETSCLQLQV